MAKRSYFFREWNLFFRKYPMVLTPFLLYPTYKWNRDIEGLEGTKEVLAGMFYAHTMNYLGIPAGVVSANYNDGLPVGVQIISSRFREDIILQACEEIEKRVGIKFTEYPKYQLYTLNGYREYSEVSYLDDFEEDYEDGEWERAVLSENMWGLNDFSPDQLLNLQVEFQRCFSAGSYNLLDKILRLPIRPGQKN